MRLGLLACLAATGLATIPPSAVQLDTVVVVMAYNRIDSLQVTLNALLAQGGAKWALVVPQSFSQGNESTVAAAAGAIQRVANRVVRQNAENTTDPPISAAARATGVCLSEQGGDGQRWPCAVHAPTPAAGNSQAAAQGVRMHGSKLESSRNLLHGLALATSLSWARFVVVVEDDALLSGDAVSSLTFMHRDVMSAEWTPWGSGRPERVRLGTTQALLRPGLFTDMSDWSDLSSSVAVSAAEAQLAAAGQEGGRHALAARVDVRRATGRAVVRTFAWTMDATLAKQLAALLAAQTAQPRPANDDGVAGGPRPPADAGGLGHLVEWCSWCSPLCYDHAVEALAAGSLFAVTAIPRSASPVNVGLSGAVSKSDSTRRQFRGPAVAASQWWASFDEGDPSQRACKADGGWWEATSLAPQARPNVMPSESMYFQALGSGPRRHAHVPLESVHYALPFALRDPAVIAALTGVFGIVLGGLLLA